MVKLFKRDTPARLLEFDGIRGLAVILVFLYHIQVVLVQKPINFFNHNVSFLWSTSLGMDLLFVLSGFFVWMSLDRPTQSVKTFYKKRLMRIVPLYYFSLGLLLLLMVPIYLGSFRGWFNILLHLLFLHSILPEAHGAINGVYWTLSLEMIFYLIAPGLFWLMTKYNRWLCIILIWSLSLIYRGLIFWLVFPHISNPWYWFIYIDQFPGRLAQFGWGIGLYFLWKRTSKLQSKRLPLISFFGGLIGLGALQKIAYGVGGNFYVFWPTAIFWNFGIATLFSALIFGIMSQIPWILRIFRHPGLTFVGQIGYSVFIWHLVIIKQMATLPVPVWLQVLYSLVFTAIISMASYRIIEQHDWSKGIIPWFSR